jgi:hypothetical protein
LTYRRTWGSYDNAAASTGDKEFTSAPLRAPFGGYLKFELSGDVTASGNQLELRDAFTGERLATIRPNKAPGDSWRAAYVAAPSEKFVIYARSAKGAPAFAFSEPVEMPSGTYWAWILNKNGPLIAQLAAILALCLGLLHWIANRSEKN